MLLSNVIVKFSSRHNQYYAYVGHICITIDFSFVTAPSDLSDPFTLEGIPYPSASDNISFNFIVKNYSIA